MGYVGLIYISWEEMELPLTSSLCFFCSNCAGYYLLNENTCWIPIPLFHLCFVQERLLSRQGQKGWNQLFDLLQAELATRPADAHVNVKLIQLFCQDGRLDEAVKHCLATERRGMLHHSLDWYTVVVRTLQVSTVI